MKEWLLSLPWELQGDVAFLIVLLLAGAVQYKSAVTITASLALLWGMIAPAFLFHEHLIMQFLFAIGFEFFLISVVWALMQMLPGKLPANNMRGHHGNEKH